METVQRLISGSDSRRLTVYGFGTRGRDVIDQMASQGLEIHMIFDKNPIQSSYRGIAIRNLSDPIALEVARNSTCVIALHNSYVDIGEVNAALKAANAKPVSLVNADKEGILLTISQGYWLDKDSTSFLISKQDAEWMLANLADSASCNIFKSLKNYRESGKIEDCPVPSLTDEYTPKDLVAYTSPVHLLDCGAYTGVAYRKILQHYAINKYLGFEPDPENFLSLASNKFYSEEVTLLPLGVSDKTEILRFSSGKEMGSSIDNVGESLIQCVAVDDVAKTFDANLVKFDIEGAEMRGLIGMRKLIERNRPSLCVSVYHKPEDLVDIPKLIASWNLDYKLYLRVHEFNAFGAVLYALPSSPIHEDAQ
jgi:FkbM family methyltransferase